jgi:urea transport system permease protein
VLLLMGLGLAIIFGQMGVINMAHGEFMTIGAYTIYLLSSLTEPTRRTDAAITSRSPSQPRSASPSSSAGWSSGLLIRHLYTSGRSTRCSPPGACRWPCSRCSVRPSAPEVSPTLPDWLMGSWAPAEGLDIPINGMFVMASRCW